MGDYKVKPITIVFDDIHYRMAGFRPPRKGERYISKAGYVATCQQNFEKHVPRMIVRPKTIDELENL